MTEASNAPRGRLVRATLPLWFRVVLAGSALWLGVALIRGLTYALSRAAYGG
jgi:hypothetical protein